MISRDEKEILYSLAIMTLCLFIILLLASCTNVQIKDGEVCANAPDGSASCFHMFSDSSRDLSKEEWDELRVGWLSQSPELYANIESALESECQTHHDCSYEVDKQVRNFFLKLNSTRRHAMKRK